MTTTWTTLKEWPELKLERMHDAGVARIVLNRPEKRNCLNPTLVDAFFESLEIIRADRDLKIVITKGAGSSFSSGLDLHYLRGVANGRVADWDRPGPTIALTKALRDFPRIMIAQVHGYCLGGAFALMNVHDLVIAADTAQIGMPELVRGSFGQIATSTLLHAQIPVKKAVFIQLLGRNLSGTEADRLGLVSLSVAESSLETTTNDIAAELSSRHSAPLENAKLAVQLGRELPLSQALDVDRLIGWRQRLSVDPTANLEEYLSSQKGGTNTNYQRPDVIQDA
ncbi:enoyl-CoA hydratase/isomerase family protein [Paraburkholderia caffeinilytica]|uniref:p-hydroxycinnamoyl CoA hydratase/lyase n=1 Tax=Paraburkholderia caffeinilytica TaxID=1761016 RepID=A0ABQ1LR51_9BURK|nr:enoyl-CoA hydratase/isomerase family protein [Paraburkholderia caffeinilytica]GGC26810.1 p-hydroxycinnamoyl CoA hydratase/lyase [Paraburkholderia caffeinilytica]CAB3779882.1 Hydroxycinnamoyl-CoA hydratase-lyase [Paraburkholderia caffeinilytica]